MLSPQLANGAAHHVLLVGQVAHGRLISDAVGSQGPGARPWGLAWGPTLQSKSPWGGDVKEGANVHISMSRPVVSSQKK